MRTVYILHCSDNTFYTGITTNVIRRIKEHNIGILGAKYTRARRPVQLIWSQQVENRSEASKLELIIKKMTRKDKIEMIQSFK